MSIIIGPLRVTHKIIDSEINSKKWKFGDIVCGDFNIEVVSTLSHGQKGVESICRYYKTVYEQKNYEQFVEPSANQYKATWQVINFENYPVKTTTINLDPELTNSYFFSSVFDLTKKPLVTNSAHSTTFSDHLVKTRSL